jgi:hypothetical protein
MNEFKEKYEQDIVGVIDVFEFIQKVDKTLRRKIKQYAEDKRKIDSFVTQYVELKLEKERELYILLLQLNAHSEIFDIQFQSVANAIASDESIQQNWLEELKPYRERLRVLLNADALQPQI